MLNNSLFFSNIIVIFIFLGVISCQVIELTSRNFNEKVLQSEGPWIVSFTAPWCGHCQRLKPEYHAAAESLGGVVNLGNVNCDEEKDLAYQYGVRGFPTIKYFPAGRAKKSSPEDYQSGRDANSIVQYAMSRFDNLQDPTIFLKDEESLDKFLLASGGQSGNTKSSTVPTMMSILLTNKKKNPALFKSLAVEYGWANRMRFGWMNDEKLMLSLKLIEDPKKELPRIIFIPPLTKPTSAVGSSDETINLLRKHLTESAVVYNSGPLKKDKIVEFYQGQLKKHEPRPAEKLTTIDKGASSSVSVPDITEKNYGELCGNLCVLGCGSDRSLFQSIAQRYKADFSKLNFIWAGQIVDQKEISLRNMKFCKEFLKSENEDVDLNGSGVTLVAVRGKRLKIATLKNVRATVDTERFVESLLFGGAAFSNIDELHSNLLSPNKQQTDEL